MKKLLTFLSLSIFLFVLSACTQVKTPETQNNVSSQETNGDSQKTEKKEQIKQVSTNNTIDSVNDGDLVSSPVLIHGKTNALRNKLHVELRDSNHEAKVRGYAIVKEKESEANDYSISLNFVFSGTKDGYLAVYELDENGKEINLTETHVLYKTQ